MKLIRLVFAVMCFSIPFSVLAQQHEKLAPETYGTSSLTYLSLSPWDFRPIDSTVNYAFSEQPFVGLYRTNSTGSTRFEAPLRLPEGAIVSYLEMYSCNNVGGGTCPACMLSTFRGLKSDFQGSWSAYTGPNAPPGTCGTTSTMIAPVLIDNTTTSYSVEVTFVNPSFLLTLIGYRVGYKLQVSPPPGTATFTDVPTTHLFYQYVEALAAAGITSGCGGGNFCPDAAVTRGQMAVFLSKALGLHWAP